MSIEATSRECTPSPALEPTVAELKPVRLRNIPAAEYCGFAPKTLTNMRWRGVGPRYHRAGPAQNATVFYLVADLDAWMAEQIEQSEQVAQAPSDDL